MIPGRKHRVNANRTVKIPLGSPEIPKIIFCNAAEEIIPIVGRIQLGQNIEVFYCQGVFSIRKRPSAPHEEGVLVILRSGLRHACKSKHARQNDIFQKFTHKFLYSGYFS